MYEPDHMLL